MHNNNNGYPSSTRAWVTVAILMLAYVLSFVDQIGRASCRERV